jgi:hypothetical protein
MTLWLPLALALLSLAVVVLFVLGLVRAADDGRPARPDRVRLAGQRSGRAGADHVRLSSPDLLAAGPVPAAQMNHHPNRRLDEQP